MNNIYIFEFKDNRTDVIISEPVKELPAGVTFLKAGVSASSIQEAKEILEREGIPVYRYPEKEQSEETEEEKE